MTLSQHTIYKLFQKHFFQRSQINYDLTNDTAALTFFLLSKMICYSLADMGQTSKLVAAGQVDQFSLKTKTRNNCDF